MKVTRNLLEEWFNKQMAEVAIGLQDLPAIGFLEISFGVNPPGANISFPESVKLPARISNPYTVPCKSGVIGVTVILNSDKAGQVTAKIKQGKIL